MFSHFLHESKEGVVRNLGRIGLLEKPNGHNQDGNDAQQQSIVIVLVDGQTPRPTVLEVDGTVDLTRRGSIQKKHLDES